MIHDRVPRWFSGIIRPSGFLTQEFTSLSMGEVPRSIRGWGPFCCHHVSSHAVLGVAMFCESIGRRDQNFKRLLERTVSKHVHGGWFWLANAVSVTLQSMHHDVSLPSNEANLSTDCSRRGRSSTLDAYQWDSVICEQEREEIASASDATDAAP